MANHGTCDVVIVGAGLAGASAAVDLRRAGLDVLIVEARDRVGGRSYVREAAESGEPLDLGGAWITPWQRHIRAAAAEHDIALRPRLPVLSRRWFRDGGLHHDFAAAPGDWERHTAAISRLAHDAMAYAAGRATGEGGVPLHGISLADYLDRVDPPAATRDLVSAWWTVSGNADKSIAPVGELLHSLSYHDGTPDGICEVWVDSLVGGVGLLARRMIDASGAELRLDWPVTGITDSGGGVEVTGAGRPRLLAKAAIVATGVNPMRRISFSRAGSETGRLLTDAQAAALREGHAGRAVKAWAKVAGVAPGVLATGGGSGIEWVFAERETADGATMLVGFGVDDQGTPMDAIAAMRAAVARFFPEATILAVDWHDWNSDPASLGTWVASRVDDESALSRDTWRMQGPVAFASSDIAAEQAGWFEAAIISGRDAAGDVAAFLG